MSQVALPRSMVQVNGVDLLVRGTESWALSREQAERMRPHIRDCTHVEITDSDHMVYVDNPKEFDPAFDAWLEGL
jgi:pimeloyl-ACP methyl ester carboxylesterase